MIFRVHSTAVPWVLTGVNHDLWRMLQVNG